MWRKKIICGKTMTEKEHTQAMQKALARSEDLDLIDKHLSATYLLFSLGIDHLEQAEDTLRKYNLCCREIKQSANAIDKQFDRMVEFYHKQLDIHSEAFAADFYKYSEQVNELLGLKE